MKKGLTAIAFAIAAALSGCAVVPAYGPGPYYEEPYYGRSYYYGPPVVVVPGPIYFERYDRRHGHRHGGRGWHR